MDQEFLTIAKLLKLAAGRARRCLPDPGLEYSLFLRGSACCEPIMDSPMGRRTKARQDEKEGQTVRLRGIAANLMGGAGVLIISAVIGCSPDPMRAVDDVGNVSQPTAVPPRTKQSHRSPPTLGSRIVKAAAEGRLDDMKRLVHADPDVVSRSDASRARPLNYAILNEHRGVIVYLLEHGARINQPDKRDGELPLHNALLHRKQGIAKLLIERGADIHAKSSGGRSTLDYAATVGDLDFVDYLIREGVDVNSQSTRGATALYSAALFDHRPVVRRLIEAGAKVNPKSSISLTPLFAAASKVNSSPAAWTRTPSKEQPLPELLLARGAKLDVHSAFLLGMLEQFRGPVALDQTLLATARRSGDLLMHEAARTGRKDIVDALLEAGADANVPNPRGRLPLELAIRGSHGKIVQQLLLKGVDPNASSGRAALHAAIETRQLPMVRLLLTHKANPDGVRGQDTSPLHLAVQLRQAEIAQALLGAEATADAHNNRQRTPLFYVQSETMARLLVKHRANVNAADRDGARPLHLLASLRGHGPSYSKYFVAKRAAMAYLLKSNADPNAQRTDGNTPLHVAVEDGYHQTVEMLLESGAEVDIQNVAGQSPLHLAARLARLDIIIQLIERGASANLRDKHGWTPLHMVAGGALLPDPNSLPKGGPDPVVWQATKAHVEVARALLAAGANPGLQTSIGQTPNQVSATRLDDARKLDQRKKVFPRADEYPISTGFEALAAVLTDGKNQ